MATLPRSISFVILGLLSLSACAKDDQPAGGDAAAHGTPTSVTKSNGDGQTGIPRSYLPGPMVLVTDAYGDPVAGASVTFTITEGGGFFNGGGALVTNATAETNASGLASCGQWVLGPELGRNTVTAVVGSLAPVTFDATANPIALRIVYPYPGLFADGRLDVHAEIRSIYDLTSVIAATDAGSAPMVEQFIRPFGWGWHAEVSFGDLAPGTRPVRVTATDAQGNVAETVFDIEVNRLPVVTVVADEVAQPTLSVNATCTDDNGPCQSLRALVNLTEVASGTSSLQQTLDLSAYRGLTVSLIVVGTDVTGKETRVVREIVVAR